MQFHYDFIFVNLQTMGELADVLKVAGLWVLKWVKFGFESTTDMLSPLPWCF